MAKKLTRKQVLARLADAVWPDPGDLSGANLSGVNLSRVQFGGAKLVKADLRNANLRQADFYNPDITGARFEGANFEGCTLFHLEFADDQFAHGGRVGRHLRRLQKLAGQCKRLRTEAEVRLRKESVSLEINSHITARSRYISVNWTFSRQSVSGSSVSLIGAFIKAANAWGHGTLQPFQVSASATGCPLHRRELLELARAAWCEAFAAERPTGEARLSDQARRARLKKEMLALLRGGKEGVAEWNARHDDQGRLGSLRGTDLTGAKLKGAHFHGLDLREASFDDADLRQTVFEGHEGLRPRRCDLSGASFRKADLLKTDLRGHKAVGARFDGARLDEANLRLTNFRKACFKDAYLTGADLSYADLRGADLSQVAAMEEAVFEQAVYDNATRFPRGYPPPDGLRWKGQGSPPTTY
jgi:uncharacterized protein YjbI with pentapeptide repeats